MSGLGAQPLVRVPGRKTKHSVDLEWELRYSHLSAETARLSLGRAAQLSGTLFIQFAGRHDIPFDYGLEELTLMS